MALSIGMALVAYVTAVSGSQVGPDARRGSRPTIASPLVMVFVALGAVLVVMAGVAAARGDWFLAGAYLVGLLPVAFGIWLSRRLRIKPSE